MKSKVIKLILVCLLCLALISGIVWAVQTWFHH